MVASPEDEIRLNNGFLEQLIMYYNATENIYLKLLRTKKGKSVQSWFPRFFFVKSKISEFFELWFLSKNMDTKTPNMIFLYKKLTFSKHFLATFWQCSQSGKLNAYTIRKSRGWFCVFRNFAEKSGQPAHISFLRFFKTRGTLLFSVPVTESQVPKVNRLRRKM